jgi:hypothetical protein
MNTISSLLPFKKLTRFRKTAYTIMCLTWLVATHTTRPSPIQAIDSFSEVQNLLNTIDTHTLVVFDVDYTLTAPIDTFRQQWWFYDTEEGHNFHCAVARHANTQLYPRAFHKNVTARFMNQSTDQPIESLVVELIKSLQERSIKVIALTKCDSGSLAYDIIPSLPVWRYQKLRDVGIDFSSSFGNYKIRFKRLVSEQGNNPVFYRGVLLTDSFSKGRVLGEFLDFINWRPHSILFFDDQQPFIVSVQEAAAQRKIPFHGFLYKGLQKVPKVLNNAILQIQLKHFYTHNEFISDKDAQYILTNS